uniref:Membrane protease subunit stomatin/prohibitin-like protein n=1 Tax=uncultured marine group II/III euryarchaeote KM3_155_E06 TaxID=1457897 RepID=A0A075GJU5_9EURY|nr:membrane protease subunit stomatin/prohibitin-like protein [uncultured marine group II/III euryarchaeote KM3_155_E06]
MADVTWVILESLCGLLCGGMVAALILGMKAAGGMYAASSGDPTGYSPRGTWPRRGVFTVLDQYERAARFTFGKASGVNSVGIAIRFPFIQEFVLVDIRDRPENIPGQVCITRDNVSIQVDGVVYWKVIEPMTSVLAVSDPSNVIRQATMSVLRVVIGEYALDELLSKREVISLRMEKLLDTFSHPLGIDISRIDITDVVIPTDMQRAMAREAEAQRERRARLRRAEGEVEAVKNLAHAAHTMQQNPELLELRRLQTVGELGMEQHTLITLVLPYDFGNIGGGGRHLRTFTVEDNMGFLDALGIAEAEALESAEAARAEAEVETVDEPEAESPIPDDLPPAPDFGDEPDSFVD